MQVTRNGGSAAVESADGKTLFFVKTVAGNRTSLWRMPVGGGDEAQVVPSLFRYNFARDADGRLLRHADRCRTRHRRSSTSTSRPAR